MIAEAGPSFAFQVGVLVALLAGALVVGVLAERLKVPYVVALVAAGLAVSLNRDAAPFDFGGSLLFFFLPALLFEAAWNLRIEALLRTWRSIATLAVPGVLVTLAIVAALMASVGGLEWKSALVLGAIVSATDPVAVIATFRRLRAPLYLQTIVEGESLANDGVAAVLAAGLVAAATGAATSLPLLGVETVAVAAGGVAIGICCAYAVSFLLRGIRDAEMQTVGTVLVAYGAYVIAFFAHTSGIFATIAAGIALRAISERNEQTDTTVETFWGVVAFVTNSMVFLLVGMQVHVDRLVGEPGLLLAAIGAAIASRLVVAFGLPGFPELRAGGFGWRFVIALAGMRGALALALALALPAGLAARQTIIDAVFAIVLFTVLVQGLAIGPVVARLRPTAEA